MKEDTPEAMTAETRKLAAMHLFSDEALWAATAPSFSPTEEYRLSQLNAAAGERDLTPAEDAEQQSLITAYQRSVLRRAKALAILAQRGHRVPISKSGHIFDPGQILPTARHSGRAARDPESKSHTLDSRLRGNDGALCFCFQA
jgi:hypothetical protein